MSNNYSTLLSAPRPRPVVYRRQIQPRLAAERLRPERLRAQDLGKRPLERRDDRLGRVGQRDRQAVQREAVEAPEQQEAAAALLARDRFVQSLAARPLGPSEPVKVQRKLVGGKLAGDGEEDPELEDMKRRVQEMEEEANKLKAMQQDLAADGGEGEEKKASETDEKSIYVGQVDYEATPEELQAHFANCGTINRVTISVSYTHLTLPTKA